MMIEKVYVPNVPTVERRTVAGTVTTRAVDLDVHDHSKKNPGHDLSQQKKDEDTEDQHPPVADEKVEKSTHLDVVA